MSTCNTDADCADGQICKEDMCTPCFDICPNEFVHDPVCVGNDFTHLSRDNVCEMETENCYNKGLGLRVLYKGPCQKGHLLTG